MKSTLYPSPWAAMQANASAQPSPEEEIFALLEDSLKGAAKKGAQRLLSGEVTLEEAAKGAKKVGLSPSSDPMPTPRPNASPSPFPEALAAPAARIEGVATQLQPRLTGAPAVNTGGAKGRTAQAEVALDQKGLTNVQRMLTLEPDQLKRLKAMAMGIDPDTGVLDPEDPYQISQAGIGQLQAMLGDVARQPKQLDLSPIMALADSLTGSKLLAGYTKPKSDRDLILKYADEIQQRKAAQSKYVVDAVKAMKAGTQTDLLQAVLAEKFLNKQDDGQRGTGGMGRPDVKATNYLKTFRSEKGFTKAVEAIAGSDAAASVIGTKENWVNDQMLKSGLLQAARLYPISNMDVNMFQGNPALFNRAKQMWNRLVDGRQLEPEDADAILAYTNAVRLQAAETMTMAADAYSRTMGPQFGYDPSTARSLLESAMVEEGVAKKTGAAFKAHRAKTKQAAPKASGLTAEEQKRLEELRARKKAAGGS